jgi:hypothetical protein
MFGEYFAHLEAIGTQQGFPTDTAEETLLLASA